MPAGSLPTFTAFACGELSRYRNGKTVPCFVSSRVRFFGNDVESKYFEYEYLPIVLKCLVMRLMCKRYC